MPEVCHEAKIAQHMRTFVGKLQVGLLVRLAGPAVGQYVLGLTELFASCMTLGAEPPQCFIVYNLVTQATTTGWHKPSIIAIAKAEDIIDTLPYLSYQMV